MVASVGNFVQSTVEPERKSQTKRTPANIFLSFFNNKTKTMLSVQQENELMIDTLLTRKAALVLRAINHPLRQQMLKIIHQKETITVTQLYIILRLEQSVASQHLAILRKAGLVTTERKAKNIFYSVNYAQLDHLHNVTATLINGPVESLA